jgi:diaminohydroxyphosphoribosylaminopyrimidine deaminase / 5-amino-6-(5-phosphoribosylamino)uracil reductase
MNVDPIENALNEAIQAARAYEGRTAPNPPVGAAALDAHGRVISVQAHPGAGNPHAEAMLLRDCEARGLLADVHTVVVTLEPCAHTGRTPPCSEALVQAASGPCRGLKRVVYGAEDPNPLVSGRGARILSDAGLEVIAARHAASAELILPFGKWITTRRPWVTVKTVHRAEGADFGASMIPPPGAKTFSSDSSLRLAHTLRRRADAILTGSGTILADNPLFTVRHVPDHASDQGGGRDRWLVVLDRRGRIPAPWLEQARERGLKPHRAETLEDALTFLGEKGCIEVLVEAGPTLSAAVLSSGLWDRHVVIRVGHSPELEDRIEDVYRNHSENHTGR